MAIDCFSKFVFVEPLKRKTTEAIIDGFTRIFKKTTRRPENLRTDKGGEYNSRKFCTFMKENDIAYSTTQNPDIKCSIAERSIRTIKNKIFKYLAYKGTFRYIDVLNDIVKSYNDGFHRTIKMAPSNVNDKNILQVYRNIRESQKIPVKKKRAKLRVGNYVRITKTKGAFERGFMPGWSSEIFKVKSIARRNPIVYYLEDLAGEEIVGTFYEMEVQKVNFDEGASRAIEKVIKQRTRGKSIQYLVKWQSYPNSFNSWVDSKTVTKP